MVVTISKQQILKKIHGAKDLVALEKTYRELLGSKGEVTQLLGLLKDAPEKERAKKGKELNELKKIILDELRKKRNELRLQAEKGDQAKEWIDITLPGAKIDKGSLHPLSRIIRETQDIFSSMGFEIVFGPDIETDYYNFDALNMPPEHPARDLWDTFWLRSNQSKQLTRSQMSNVKCQRLLLRTHTSPAQIHYMETHQPPFRIIVPGRCFRYEATDASHDIQFYQVEGLMVGEDISMVNLRAVIEEFFRKLFKKDIKIRFRPSYFPFVEPGVEVDISCLNCGGKGCSVCSKKGWLEMLGAGMVHPNVFKAVGYNPKFWQGFAFGVGLDRIAMMKYKIDDIRLLYNGDLRFLKQF